MNKAFNKSRHDKYAWQWCIKLIDSMVKDIESSTADYKTMQSQVGE